MSKASSGAGPPSAIRSCGAVVSLIFAVLALNVALGFYNYWPTPWIALKAQFSVEAALVVLGLTLLAWWRQPLTAQGATWLATGLLVLVIGRYIDVTAPALYGRPINLYWDSQHVPAVVAMLSRVASWWQLLGVAIAVLLALTALLWLLQRIVLRIASATAQRSQRRWLAGGSIMLVSAWVIGNGLGSTAVERWFAHPVSLSWAMQFDQLRRTLSEDVARDFAQLPLPVSDLAAIRGADVLVMFVESYGATTLDKPEHAATLAPVLSRLEKVVAATGRHLASGRVTSPTFGGGSWLAHSSFLAGYEVRDGATYEHLLASERQTWIRSFAAAGYRTLGLLPGIRMAWPEGQFYQFDKIYDAKTLNYQGAAFGWWRIPDQYSLAKLEAEERGNGVSRQPVLTFFTTISSHAPFRPVAPYKSDWTTLLGALPYGPDEAGRALTDRPDWLNLSPGYLESIEYALNIVAGYLERRRDDDLTLVVIGDHQPTASVTGPQASWQVPVHIISNRKPVIDKLLSLGLSDGVIPPTIGQGPMHEFSGTLLNVFGGSGGLQPGIDISGPVTGSQPG